MIDRGFYIDIGYATFGIFSRNGIIVEAAPIANLMIGKSLKDVKYWLIKKKAKVVELNLKR